MSDTTHVIWKFADDQSAWSGALDYYHLDEYIASINLITPNLCLGEIIDAYGEPDYLNQTAYESYKTLDLLWQDKGFVFERGLPSPSVEITSRICGGELKLFQVGIPMNDIPSLYFMRSEPDDFTEWTGYGKY
jgi:hypothetical protein